MKLFSISTFAILLTCHYFNAQSQLVDTVTHIYGHAQLSSPALQIFPIGGELPLAEGWQRLYKMNIMITFDTGEDYEFGTAPFDAHINKLTCGFYDYETDEFFSQKEYTLSINEKKPETCILIEGLLPVHANIRLKFEGYSSDLFVQNKIRLKVDVINNYRIDPPFNDPSVNNLSYQQIGGNRYRFTWSSPFNTCHYRFQLLKLENSSGTPSIANDTTKAFAYVEWASALDLELESCERELKLTLAQG
ncbi:MAG: hypothetical protein HY738_17680, partial [Bacteroidia bacterium]|nr:hypothetical protein [Bacteroidia bacterium]